MAAAGGESRRGAHTLSRRQAAAPILTRGAWEVSDHYRRVRRVLLYRRLVTVHRTSDESARRRRRILHDRAKRPFGERTRQTGYLVSDRAGRCIRPRPQGLFLVETDHLRQGDG